MGWLMASLTQNTIPDESLRLEWCFSSRASICIFTPLSALPKWTIETSESCVLLRPPLWTSQWPFSSVGGRAAFHPTLQTLQRRSMRPEKILHKDSAERTKWSGSNREIYEKQMSEKSSVQLLIQVSVSHNSRSKTRKSRTPENTKNLQKPSPAACLWKRKKRWVRCIHQLFL